MKILRKLIHYLRYFTNLFFQDPKIILQELKEDWKKDKISIKIKKNHNLIWICSLPKSGSTLVEEIVSFYPYVKLDRSLKRFYSSDLKKYSHDISHEMLESAPKNILSFLKTHTPYNKKFIEISKKFNLKIIITFRDIRDVMISRYHHILADPNHDQFSTVSKMPKKEGFIYSFETKNYSKDGSFHKYGKYAVHNALEYYYDWIYNWKNNVKSVGGLELWYEDYILNKEKFLSKIMNFLNEKAEEDDIRSLQNYLFENKKRHIKRNLNTLINDKSKGVSTFRSGKIGNWKSFFDDEINDKFNKCLPGPLENVIKKL